MVTLNRLARRQLAPALYLCALAALTLAAHAAWQAWQAHDANRQMRDGVADAGAPPMVVFAHGVRLDREKDYDAALAAYSEAESRGELRHDTALGHAARLNASNIYLRRAIEVATRDGAAARAITLIELAKTGYRRVLRERPDEWGARYNLELAQVLVPDYEVRNWRPDGKETRVDDDALPDKAAWTEMVGAPRGMH
jgi:mxaK protein